MSDKQSREKTIASTYTEIYKHEQNGDYDRCLKASNRILHMAPQEATALHCKIVSLIQLSKFDEAWSTINKNAPITNEFYFEKAYCQYRLNQPQEALKTIEQAGELDFRLKELKAQVLYRLEDYSYAFQVYQDIVKNADDEYSDERETNLGAVLVNLDKSKNSSMDLREDTYELCYNKACLLISQNNYIEAEKKLKQCEKLCRESFEDDGTPEEEIEIELALIRIQLAYVYQKQGRTKEAQQLYVAALKLKLDDVALAAVASNNVVVINKDQNVFDSKKKMKVATNEALVHKLPSVQRKYIALNNAIFNYYTNQMEQCNKICASMQELWPDLSNFATVLTAMHLAKADKVKDAIDLLEKFKATNEEDKIFLQMCCVHLLLTQGDKQQACNKLQAMNESYHKPGIVGALITLYLGLGKEEEALKVFEKTVDWYKKNKLAEGDLSNLWGQAAEFHIRSGHPNVAANSLEELLRTTPNDKKAKAQLILAYAQFDKQKAISMGKELVPLKELAKGVDMESLESSNWLTTKRNVSTKPESPGSHGSDSVEKKRKHKKRKGKLPKNYDASVAPDPERWLPKYERSGFRKKRDRRAKDVIKGSQGTASGQADQYDFSKNVQEQETPEPQTSVDPSPMARHQQRKGPQKKKNKRR